MIEPNNRHERRRAAKFERVDERETDSQGGDPALDGTACRAYVGNICEMTRWRWEREREFPPPDIVIGRRNFWRRSTLDAWLDKMQMQQRKAAG
jgi:predicted DNA-binding transcriptional regulator AlpA